MGSVTAHARPALRCRPAARHFRCRSHQLRPAPVLQDRRARPLLHLCCTSGAPLLHLVVHFSATFGGRVQPDTFQPPLMVNSAPATLTRVTGACGSLVPQRTARRGDGGGGEGARVGEMGTWERVLGYVIDVGRLSVPMTGQTTGQTTDQINGQTTGQIAFGARRG